MPSLIDENAPFFDTAGLPIVNGLVYVGLQNNDPIANPITIYSDRALTTPIDNPQSTDAYGRPTNKIWVPGEYSVQCNDSSGQLKYQDLDAGSGGAEDITYTPAGTGAVSTNVQAKLRESISVKDFGAVGDGVTDDTTAIQTAVDTGEPIFFPPGSYLTDSITLLSDSVVKGSGVLQTTIVANSNTQNIFTLATTTGLVNGVHIADLKIDGNAKTSIKGIYLNGTSSTNRISINRFDNIYITDCATGIEIFYCVNTVITDCFFNDCVEGLHINISADTDVSNTKAQLGTGVGFQITGGAGAFDEGVRLTNCSTNGQDQGISVDGSDWGNISNCSFTTAAGGAGFFENTCQNWKIIGTDFAVAGGTPANRGLECGALCSGFKIIGCEFQLNTFGLTFGGFNSTISGNYFLANSNVDLDIPGAIRCAISDNICESTGSLFSILESGSSDYNNIGNNITDGTVTLTGANSIAHDNIVF